VALGWLLLSGVAGGALLSPLLPATPYRGMYLLGTFQVIAVWYFRPRDALRQPRWTRDRRLPPAHRSSASPGGASLVGGTRCVSS
jgi:hypothetical protein